MLSIPVKALLAAVLLILGMGMAILFLRLRDQEAEIASLRAEIDGAGREPNSTSKSASKITPATTPVAGAEATKPTKPVSVVDGPDTPLILEGRKLLTQGEGPVRNTQWGNLLAKATTFDLSRMTEIVNQAPAPTNLDEDRKNLRLMVIQQFQSRGELPQFLQKRQEYDWPKSSHVQELCWHQLASTDPNSAIVEWKAREDKLATDPPNPKILDALVRGLAAAPSLATAAEAIKQLSEKHQALIRSHLSQVSLPK